MLSQSRRTARSVSGYRQYCRYWHERWRTTQGAFAVAVRVSSAPERPTFRVRDWEERDTKQRFGLGHCAFAQKRRDPRHVPSHQVLLAIVSRFAAFFEEHRFADSRHRKTERRLE